MILIKNKGNAVIELLKTVSVEPQHPLITSPKSRVSLSLTSKKEAGQSEQPEQEGESWTETPDVYHTVSENASDTKAAKLLAIFVADAKQNNELPVTVTM